MDSEALSTTPSLVSLSKKIEKEFKLAQSVLWQAVKRVCNYMHKVTFNMFGQRQSSPEHKAWDATSH